MSQDFSKNELKAQLKENVDHMIYVRGVDYYRRRKVKNIAVSAGKEESDLIIKGEVSGSDDYEAELIFNLAENYFHDLDCSCPYGVECKHSVALGLKFIDLFEKFLDEYEYYDTGIDSVREDLIDFMNYRKAADKMIFSRKRSKKKKSENFLKKNIIEGEFESKDGEGYKNEKDLIKELTVALSTGNASQATIDKLIKSLIELKKKNSLTQKKFLTQGSTENRFNSLISLPAVHHEPKIFDLKKYRAIIEYTYTLQVKIY